MKILVVALVCAYLGYPAEPVYAAEPLTVKQMDQVTAGAGNLSWLTQRAFSRVVAIPGGAAVATSSNSVTVSQCNGCP